MVELFSTPPWAKTQSETDIEYEAFKIFRDMLPMERPEALPKLCAKFGLEDWQIKDLARKHDWLLRCAKYDVWLDAARRQAAIKARAEAGTNMVRLSQQVIKWAETAMEVLTSDPNKIPSYREAVEMVRLAIELNKAGLGLQGLATAKDTDRDAIDTESPNELIEAAVQINYRIRKRVKDIPIDEADVIDGESRLIEENIESGGPG